MPARPQRWTVSSTLNPIGLLMVAAAIGVVSLAVTGLTRDIFEDDAYYYTVIARNFASSGRFTFDGFSETSGFHPLLFWIQVAVAAVTGPRAAPGLVYRTLLALDVIVLLGLVAALARASRGARAGTQGGAGATVAALAIGFCFMRWGGHLALYLDGMESTLTLPLVVLLVACLHDGRDRAAGVAGALLVAARLDSFLYVVLPLAFLWALRAGPPPGRVRRALRTFAAIVLPAAVFLAALLLFDSTRFGSWMPIHGALKSTFPHLHVQWFNVLGYNIVGPAYGLRNILSYQPLQALVLAVLGTAALARPAPRADRLRFTGLALAIVTFCELAGFALFQRWSKPVPVWYMGLPLWTGAAAAAAGVACRLPERALRALAVGAGLLLLGLNGMALVRSGVELARHPAFTIAERTEIIAFVRSRAGDAPWAGKDCGQLSFWSGRRFVNLDGLTNDAAYQARLRDRQLGAYLAERGVRYLVMVIWSGPLITAREYEPMYRCQVAPDVFEGRYATFRYDVYAYRYGVYSEPLLLPRAAEIWRSAPFEVGRVRGRYVVFDLAAAGLDGRAALPGASGSLTMGCQNPTVARDPAAHPPQR